MREIPAPPPVTDDLDAARLVLKDGSVVGVRVAGPTDKEGIRQFFHNLSGESRRSRFFSASEPDATVIDRVASSPGDRRALTLIASRQVDGRERVVAVASFVAISETAAEVAFAVDDRFQNKGISTLFLERLAAHAVARGFQRFHATTLADNRAMREVFRESGFEIRSRSSAGTVDLQLLLTPSAEGIASAERRRRLATTESLRPMLLPRAIAVVGASRDPGKMGGRLLHALRRAGFTGRIHLVHPQAAEIGGLKAFPSARELPPGVDLALIAVPPAAVLDVVDDCAAAGVKALVVITAGFAEVGAEGRERQEALMKKVREHGMRMIGPNCMGLLNTDPAVRLNASFSPLMPPEGRVAFSSQSGALGIAILRLAAERDVGLSAFVSVGNKADVSSNDLLEFWEGDPRTSVILLYLESFGNPRRFSRLARRIGRQKPIVVLKAGRTRAGSRAAGSHTAALAASDVGAEALFRQSGVIRADTIDEMFDIAACLDLQPLPQGSRVGIITNAGGPGILAVDACEAAGLRVVDFSSETLARLHAFLPPTATIANPVDMVASAGPAEYRAAIGAVLASEDTDAVLVIYTPVDPSRTDQILASIQEGIVGARAVGATDKPILACLMAEGRSRGLCAGTERIPTFAFPENAVRALGKVVAYATWRSEPAGLFWGFDDIDLEKARGICRTAVAKRSDGWLSDRETWDLLHAFALPAAVHSLAHTAEEAAAFASIIGFPVAAKLASARAPHKTELGLVRLNLANGQDVRKAFAEILSRAQEATDPNAIEGVIIQPMIHGGVEAIVGIAHDPVFGPLVAFGIGGITVEALGDVRFRVAPLTDRDTDSLLHDIRGLPRLKGYRGRAPADMEALRDVVLRVSRLAADVPEIVELDLNPVIALAPGQGCRIVDARVKVAAARPAAMIGEETRLVRLSALALDYDGTIAFDDLIAPLNRAAIAAARTADIKVLLVTGRSLDELVRVAGDLRSVDGVVAENGAIVHFPDSGHTTFLAPAIPTSFVDELKRRGIHARAGHCLADADADDAPRILDAIRAMELPLVLLFNKTRVMVLPQGISKATGLHRALDMLRLSARNTLAVGDAENDFAMLELAEVGAAAQWGSDVLQAAADLVVPGDGPAAIASFLNPLTKSKRLPVPRLSRRRLRLGYAEDGREFSLAVRGRNVLIAGDARSGKSWIAGLLCEQLILYGYCLCVLDPEGDYRSLEALPGVTVLGGDDPPPSPRDLSRALRYPDRSVVLDLSHLRHDEKIEYIRAALPALNILRRRTGLPHRIVLDEAHYFLHKDDAEGLLDLDLNGYTVVTYNASRLAPELIAKSEVIIVTCESDPAEIEALRQRCSTCRPLESERWSALSRLGPSQAVALPVTEEAGGDLRHFTIGARLTPHVRHREKYVDVPVTDRRAFVFKTEDDSTTARALTLRQFVDALEHFDRDAIDGHLRHGDFSRWIADVFGDRALAADLAIYEDRFKGGTPDVLPDVLNAIRSRYDLSP